MIEWESWVDRMLADYGFCCYDFDIIKTILARCKIACQRNVLCSHAIEA